MSLVKNFCIVSFAVLVSIILIRTWTLSVRSDRVAICNVTDEDFVAATPEVIGRFQQALKYETVAWQPYVYNSTELQKLTSFIKSAYPAIHNSPYVRCEGVSNHSLLFSIKGENSDLTPYMITGHLDVVPADPNLWDFPPFDATIDKGFIYARGTIDVKQIVMGSMEALEHLLSTGFRPQRSFYIGFGHDEEVTGLEGAKKISALLQSRGVKKLEYLIDEGLTIVNDIIPGMDKPVALIGTSEKGYLSFEMRVKYTTGHSSMPTEETSISILAKAMTKLTRDCHPSMFGYGPEVDTFQHLAPDMKLPHRIVMSNLWLFSPIVSWVMSRKPSTNAIARTVTSVTMVNGGVKVNVLPPEASAQVNQRIHPAQTVKEVMEFNRRLINDDRVQLTILSEMDPLPMSPYGDLDFGYQTIKNSIKQVWSDSVQAPGVMIGNTDTIHYTPLTSNIYRFSPTVMFPEDVPRFHGNNERLSVKNYEQAINFYVHLIKNSDLLELPSYHKHTDEL